MEPVVSLDNILSPTLWRKVCMAFANQIKKILNGGIQYGDQRNEIMKRIFFQRYFFSFHKKLLKHLSYGVDCESPATCEQN